MEHEVDSVARRHSIDIEAQSASDVVVRAVATISDQEPFDIDPLYDVIDPDALDAIHTPARSTDNPGDVTTEFSYEGFRVRLTGTGDGASLSIVSDDR